MSSLELYSPPNLAEALRLLDSRGEAMTIIASGSDLIPRMRKKQVAPSALLDISSFKADLRYIRQEDGVVRVGALTTVADLLNAPVFGGRLSMVREAAEVFGAPQIRNVATVGGNICSASSSEDLIPVFMALGATVKLVSARGERVVRLEDFLVGKRRTAMNPSEMLSEVSFQQPPSRAWTGYEKLGRRNMLIVALVNEALLLAMDDDLVTIRSARVALNRVAGKVPAMAVKTGGFLTGRRVTEQTITEAQKVLASELALTGDFRASARYRTEVAQVYLRRLILNCQRSIEESP